MPRFAALFMFCVLLLAAAAVGEDRASGAPLNIAEVIASAPLQRLQPPQFASASMARPPAITTEGSHKKRVLDRKFFLLAGLGTALTVADYEMTQSCMARRVCVEADPLIPRSRAGMYATNLPLNAVLYYWSYRRKAAGKKLWWLPPLFVIGSHAAGVATNLRFVGK